MRKPAVLFAAMALMAAVVATFLWIELRAERELSAQLREHVVGLEARLQSGPIPEVQPEGRVALPVAQAEPATVRVPDPAIRPVQLSAVAGLDCDRQWESQRQVAVRSPPELNLTAEEQQQYGRLYLRQLPLARVCQVDGEQPLSATDYQRELQRLLGPARYELLAESRALQNTRNNIQTFRQQLAVTANPLTEEQGRRLEETIVAENRRTRSLQAGQAAPDDPLARLQFDEEGVALTVERFERVLAAGRGYLTAQQLDVLKANFDRQLLSERAGVAARRTHIDAGGDPANMPAGLQLLALPAPTPVAPR
ncbi:MAG: hypothetical protein M3Y79_07265 [Pseudomonadota bacterium]|nr:hypothetical protein [Pseudomonadota bacterium]